MSGNLQAAIETANKKAGLGRQKAFARRSYLKQTDAQVIDMLCERAQEAMNATVAEYGPALKALNEAVKIARKHRGIL